MANGGPLSWIPRPVRPALINIVNNTTPIRRWVSKKTINRYGYAAPPRPRAVSMAADYVTWRGLTDRRYSGRHLPVPKDDVAPARPDQDAVIELFRRREFRRANDTSLLFPFFAQWFVDSFLRTKWEDKPRDQRKFQENESNHEIDLCSIYGMTEAQTDTLREKSSERRGRLRMQVIDGEEYPMNLFAETDGKLDLAADYANLYTADNFRRVYITSNPPWSDDQKRHAFAVGLEHGSSTLGNSIMNTLFMREHNRVAGIIAKAHPDWDDERVFQTTRNVVIVELLNIVISDYIVHIAPIDIRIEAVPGMAEREQWYRTNWMAVEFALLYRWHDLIPDTFTVAGNSYRGDQMVRANQLLKTAGMDTLLRDASRQYAGRIGLGNTAEFLLPVKEASLEMARGCRLPSYNAYRKYYGLKPKASFEALTGESELAGKLKALYGDIDRLEWFVGLFAEGYDQEAMMGELLVTMVANDAFTQALTNPLLAKSVYCEDTFSREGMEIIKQNRTLADLIVCNTGIKEREAVGFKVRAA
ncbi:MAG: peroxidase family protein [Allosphingosinicella sp.]|uniref:peroxidase family protein n=1 Tax=Allosphingosinicella sp. TaxID=2823234 RepID=UPI00393FB43F